MGLQGPLTAQALGRSPYDDVVEGNGENDTREPQQQYDHRGRPVNPDTKRRNRDIIRSHNEVMLVIGVAEPEHPASRPEFKSQQRHYEYEEDVGQRLNVVANRCIDVVGLFGIHGLRQRILIYRRYSQLPFYELFRRARSDFSASRDILPGVPSGLLCNLANFEVKRWIEGTQSRFTRLLIKESWDYFRAHLTLFAALQRLGLISHHAWFPAPSYFVPFTKNSPIPAPRPIDDFTASSLLRWAGEAVIVATPFLAWMAMSDTIPGLIDGILPYVLSWMPSPSEHGKTLPRPYTPPLSPQRRAQILPAMDVEPLEVAVDPSVQDVDAGVVQGPLDTTIPASQEHQAPDEGTASGTETVNRRASVFSTRGDDYPTDDEGQEGISATLISFDVEATDATEAPPGLWSAELRPSFGQDPRLGATTLPTYLDTHLTRLPAHLAARIFTNTLVRLFLAPCEATALRLITRSMLLRVGLPLAGIYNVNMADGLTLTAVVNYLGVELLLIGLSGEVWATFAAISQWLHKSEEEWKSHDEEMQIQK